MITTVAPRQLHDFRFRLFRPRLLLIGGLLSLVAAIYMETGTVEVGQPGRQPQPLGRGGRNQTVQRVTP